MVMVKWLKLSKIGNKTHMKVREKICIKREINYLKIEAFLKLTSSNPYSLHYIYDSKLENARIILNPRRQGFNEGKKLMRQIIVQKMPFSTYYLCWIFYRQVLFETYKTPACFVVNQGALALHANGETSGLVLSSGSGVTEIVPVYQGCTITNAVTTVSTGVVCVMGALHHRERERGGGHWKYRWMVYDWEQGHIVCGDGFFFSCLPL